VITLLLVTLAGLLTGILLGLFSVFPIYFAGFLIYAFHGAWSPELLLVFWMTAAIGSQFFGSVSTITLGIPGESSSLIYIQDLKSMTLSDRNRLLYQTAKGSLFAGLIALAVVWGLYHWLGSRANMLASVDFVLAVFLLVIIMFAATDRRPMIALCLLIVGVMLGPNNNYALPEWWYKIQQLFENTSFFLLVVGLMILPDLVFDRLSTDYSPSRKYEPKSSDDRTWWTILKSTVIGVFAGSVPGPAAETASAVAYHAHRRKGVFQQIVAAETANNPGVVMMFLPFFVMALPITASSLIIGNVMDIKNVDIVEFVAQSSQFFPDFSVFDVLMMVAAAVTAFYFLLSTRFIDFYVAIVKQLYGSSRWLLAILVSSMILVDMYFNETTVTIYMTLLIFFTAVGMVIKYFKTNPILLIFGVMFGDKLIWSVLQFYSIHFA
jgi:putative tricarboxylic transport membrane protein